MPKGFPDFSGIVTARWGEAVSTAVTITTGSFISGAVVDAYATESLINVSGRGRLRIFAFNFQGSAYSHDGDTIRIYVDGSLRFQAEMRMIDELNAAYIRENAGLDATTTAPVLGPYGGMIWLYRDAIGRWLRGGGIIIIDSEYGSSFEITYQNTTPEDVVIWYAVLYGEYL